MRILRENVHKTRKHAPQSAKKEFTMKKYLSIKNEVMNILVEMPKTRDNDRELYLEYIKRNGYNPYELSVYALCELTNMGILPSLESVSRARREAQQFNEEVKSTKTVTERRKKEREEYTEYFRSVK